MAIYYKRNNHYGRNKFFPIKVDSNLKDLGRPLLETGSDNLAGTRRRSEVRLKSARRRYSFKYECLQYNGPYMMSLLVKTSSAYRHIH